MAETRRDLSAEAIERAREVLAAIEARGAVGGRRPKFLYLQFLDAFRVSTVARSISESGLTAQVFTAEAVEVLLRRVVEQTILALYIEKQQGDEVLDRFLKTSASEFLKSWEQEHESGDHALPVTQLPDYRQMAEESSEELYKSYKRLSYLSHPRGALPYSLVERENLEKQGIDSREFFRRRCAIALKELGSCLDLIREAFEREDARWQSIATENPRV